jgi:hypothetical protein
MQRRKFLTLLSLGVTAAVVPTIGFSSVSTKKAAVGIIMNEFSYLTLDEQGVEQYVDAYFKYDRFTPHLDVKLKSYYLLGVKSNRSSIIDSLAKKYLLSTDFFLNKMDESRTIKYVGFYNPYQFPCANPFSHIHYPSLEVTTSVIRS